MQYHTTISLPAIRAAQLRHIAQKKNTTSLGIIDAFIRAAWVDLEGEGAALPGFELVAGAEDASGPPAVIFGADGLRPIMLAPEQAQAVADGLRELLNGTASRFKVDGLYDDCQSCFLGSRKGRGYLLTIYDTPEDVSRVPVLISGLTASVAEDLAASFAACANNAAALTARATQ